MSNEEKPLSRAAYRKQQEQHEQRAEPAKESPLRREDKRRSNKRSYTSGDLNEPAASPKLKKRLNWAIGIVAVLIVLVYLVLFFV
ncbi:hypothetical protein MK904_08125 [Loigolactobacillus coryniformis]|uniref:hypothetical protein n=1 Tax=Loigolactobacillus coryniformis TaxID=1610 RepID=UPI00234268D6|nr:hypothetical protein [Loigolactobacillus coryniformis]MDC4186069.1 hypothetical protein [Loigolactobacillus coryniformis]